MPWPMTLTLTNEAVRHENHAKRKLYKEEKLAVTIWEVMKDVRENSENLHTIEKWLFI